MIQYRAPPYYIVCLLQYDIIVYCYQTGAIKLVLVNKQELFEHHPQFFGWWLVVGDW